jgi:hypothetical protein
VSDIVERLRDYATTGNRPSLWPAAMREAADEIDRLRAINAELLEALHLVWKRIDLLEPIDAQDIQQIRAAIAKATNPVTAAIASGRAPTMEEVAEVVDRIKS